ncbi:MAG: anaerobic sulfatase maturase, partial [Dehalococcoidia bacterium]
MTTPSAAPFLVMAKPAGATCNLDCSYCYYLRKTELFPAGERFRMGDETLDHYVRSFIASSPGPEVHFVWHGGEPTLPGVAFYRRAVELQRRHARPGMTIINNLQTNGVAIDDEWCAFLAAERFHVGLSIDGPARTHDACRADKSGRPTHARVMQAYRQLVRHGIQPDVLCTLNSVTSPHPAEVYRFFLDQGVPWLQFLPVVQRTDDGGVSEWSVTPEALGGFLCAVFGEWVRHDVGRIAVQTFEDAMRVAMGQPASLCTVSETCGRMLAMEHDGGVYACDHFVDPHYRIGDVASSPLAELVDGPRQAAFGDAKRDALPAYCRACPVLASCNGGCPKDRFATSPGGE